MRYLSRTTLGELTGLNYSAEIRQKARELLKLLEEGKTPDAPFSTFGNDDVSIVQVARPLV